MAEPTDTGESSDPVGRTHQPADGGPSDRMVAHLFNDWAATGRDARMADGHRDITEQVLSQWDLRAEHRVLDAGCGNGWVIRWLLARGAGSGWGVDLAHGMVHNARGGPGHFCRADTAHLPFVDGHFSHVLSVEHLYYHPDPTAALAEWARVTQPGGHFSLIVDLFHESPGTHAWVDALPVPVHLLTADAYRDMARDAGWQNIQLSQVVDRRPRTPEAEFTAGPYFPTYPHYTQHRDAGSLVLTATRAR